MTNNGKCKNKDDLPKQTPRCGTKALQAAAIANSAEITVLIIRSSTLAIKAKIKMEKKTKAIILSQELLTYNILTVKTKFSFRCKMMSPDHI